MALRRLLAHRRRSRREQVSAQILYALATREYAQAFNYRALERALRRR